MVNLITSLLRRPSVDRYLAARFKILHGISRVERSRQALVPVEELFHAADWPGVQRVADPLWPAWQLSVRMNFFLGVAAAETGDRVTAQRYRRQMQMLLQMILDTGDGTSDEPYAVTYSSDEYDVARALGFRPQQCELVELPVDVPSVVSPAAAADLDPVRYCDVLVDEDDYELWFDVTELIIIEGLTKTEQHSALPSTSDTCELAHVAPAPDIEPGGKRSASPRTTKPRSTKPNVAQQTAGPRARKASRSKASSGKSSGRKAASRKSSR